MSTLTDFKNTLVEKLQQLVQLEVLTVVTANQTPNPAQPATGPYILTAIDLLQGDIRFEVNNTLLGDQYAAIRSAHADREKQAIAMVDAHVDLAMKVVKKIEELVGS